MKAMVLNQICDLSRTTTPLAETELPIPRPGPGEVVLKILACGVCHTELDEIEGRTPPAHFPMIPGHQVVGRIMASGQHSERYAAGQRVGVAWIYSACGTCQWCLSGQDNLCPEFTATGRDVPGGYAEYMVADERYIYPIPDAFSDIQAAPLLCAGAIGFRSLQLAGVHNGDCIGLTGFGASAHLVLKMIRATLPEATVFVFARNPREQEFSRQLGAAWAGDIDHEPPHRLHAIIDTTPAWKPVVCAMKNLIPGGRLVINAIRKEETDKHELNRLDYSAHLWMEKEIKSVANVAGSDVSRFLELAAQIPILPEVSAYSLDEANKALLELKQGKIRGGKVIVI